MGRSRLLAIPLLLLSGCAHPKISKEDRQCVSSIIGRDFESIRMGVHYAEDSVGRRDLLEKLRSRVIPELTKFWSRALKVRRMEEPLTVRRKCVIANGRCVEVKETSVCQERNGLSVPIPDHLLGEQRVYGKGWIGKFRSHTIPANEGEEVDFVLLVSMKDVQGCGDVRGGTIASAYSCRWDDCDRPLMGVVNICPRAVDMSSEQSLRSLYNTLAHEMTHVFGMNSDSFSELRYPNGFSMIPLKREVYYTCHFQNGRPRVNWNVSPDSRDPKTDNAAIRYVFPEGVVSSLKTRGIGGKECRCPINPGKQYSSADIEHCLSHKSDCAFAITTPKVSAMSRAFFGCDSVAGAELENQSTHLTCEIFDSHWKKRLFGDEFMTATFGSGTPFISPVTFAFLEDTGWYKVNYSLTTSLVPGAHSGYKAGCSFVKKKCVASDASLVKVDRSNKVFCDHSPPAGHVCSSDASRKVACLLGKGTTPIPRLYAYPLNSEDRYLDFCPVFTPLSGGSCLENHTFKPSLLETFGASARCLDSVHILHKTVSGLCLSITCHEKGTEYVVSIPDKPGSLLSLGRCSETGQELTYKYHRITCADPEIVCSAPDHPHLGANRMIHPSGAMVHPFSRLEAQRIADEVDKRSGLPSLDELSKSEANPSFFGLPLTILFAFLM